MPVVDSAVADDPVRRDSLLAFRDRITDSIAAASTAIGVPTFKLDVAVPVDRLADAFDRLQGRGPGAQGGGGPAGGDWPECTGSIPEEEVAGQGARVPALEEAVRTIGNLVGNTLSHEIGHSLGISTVAEWVETEQALAALQHIGVDFAQGFGLHRPEPLESIEGQIRQAQDEHARIRLNSA